MHCPFVRAMVLRRGETLRHCNYFYFQSVCLEESQLFQIPIPIQHVESVAKTNGNVYEWQQRLRMCNPGARNKCQRRVISSGWNVKYAKSSDESSTPAICECLCFACTEGGSKTSGNKLFRNLHLGLFVWLQPDEAHNLYALRSVESEHTKAWMIR